MHTAKNSMKNLLIFAFLVLGSVQPILATPTLPDGGSTALLAGISVAGLIAASRFIKRKR